MCYLLTVGITGGSSEAREVFHAHGLRAEPAVNPHVRAAMPTDSVLLDITDGGCSCSIYGRSIADEAFDGEAERSRYARKGWSAAKISRAIEAKQVAHGRRKTNSRAQQLCLSIEDLVRSGSCVALVSHSYSGVFAEEFVSVGARATMSLQQFLETQGTFPEDTLVTVE